MVRRAHQQQYRRIEPDVGVLSCASASRGADRGAAQVRWRPAMCCDDYPGAVVLTAPSNTYEATGVKRVNSCSPVLDRNTGAESCSSFTSVSATHSMHAVRRS